MRARRTICGAGLSNRAWCRGNSPSCVNCDYRIVTFKSGFRVSWVDIRSIRSVWEEPMYSEARMMRLVDALMPDSSSWRKSLGESIILMAFASIGNVGRFDSVSVISSILMLSRKRRLELR
jgi:hypothetical protein